MSLVIQCPRCGLKLKADEQHTGMICKCPSCSKRIQIPSQPDASKISAYDLIPLAQEDPPNDNNTSRQAAQPNQRRASYDRQSRGPTLIDHLRNVRGFGIGPKGLIIIGIIAAASIGVYIWWNSRPGIAVGQPTIVDSYTALSKIRFPSALELVAIAPIVGFVGRSDYVYERSLLPEGVSDVVVLKPWQSGEFIIIPIRISQKHLIESGAGRKWTVFLAGSHFKLKAGDRKQNAILLRKRFDDFVRVDTNPGGDREDNPLFKLRWVPVYPPLIERDSGMKIRYAKKLDDRLLELTWNEGCEAWFAEHEMELNKAYLDSHRTEFFLFFNRPERTAQSLELTYFGKKVATFSRELCN